MSRPRTQPVDRVSTNVRLPRELHERLLSAAYQRDVSVNLLVVRAVTSYLDRLSALGQKDVVL